MWTTYRFSLAALAREVGIDWPNRLLYWVHGETVEAPSPKVAVRVAGSPIPSIVSEDSGAPAASRYAAGRAEPTGYAGRPTVSSADKKATLVADPEQWQTLIADDIVWELVYAPALGHPARLSGRGEVMRHVAWFAVPLAAVALQQTHDDNLDRHRDALRDATALAGPMCMLRALPPM